MADPKIIIWDIEILADMEAIRDNWFSVYSPYKNNSFSADFSSVLCIGWKELHGKRVNCIKAWDHKARWKKNKNDDYAVLKEFYDVVSDADGIVTHNGMGFDLPFVNTRLMMHGLPPIPKTKHIDTKKISSRYLKLSKNSLDHVSKILKTANKMNSGGQKLWNAVHQNKKMALDKMAKYCKQDVTTTQEIFEKLRVFSNHIPNYNTFIGKDERPVCPSCKSASLQKHGFHTTTTKRYQRYRCTNCGKTSRTDLKGNNLRAI